MRRSLWMVLIVVFVIFSLAPSGYELLRMNDIHTDRSFELVHNFPTDYNFYLSRIREGIEGRWTVVERYTSEPHAGSLIHEPYLLLGEVGRFVRVPPGRAGDIYHVARAVLALVLLWAIAAFCIKSFAPPSYRASVFPLTAFLLAVTASSWPKLVAVTGSDIVPATLGNWPDWRFGGYMPWWSVMDSLQRITFIPHLLIGQASMLILVVLLTDEELLNKKGTALLTGIAAFVLGMVFPPGLVFIYAFMGLWMLLHIRVWKRWIVPYSSVFLVSIPSLMYLFLMTGMYPWKRLAEVDIIRPIRFDYVEYFKAVGPILPLGIAGLLMAWKRKETRLYPAVIWVGTWAALLGLFFFIPQQSPLRFSEMIPHVPLAILATYFLYRLSRAIPLRIAWTVLPACLIGIGLFHMYSSYLWQKDFVDHKIRATVPLVPTGSYVMYPLKDFVRAIQVLEEQTPATAVILSETTAGNYIPVIAGRTVYAGHDNTVRYEQKREEVATFFAGKMNPSDARVWLMVSRARYVFFGPQEQADGGVNRLESVYPFLKKFYENDHVVLYQVE